MGRKYTLRLFSFSFIFVTGLQLLFTTGLQADDIATMEELGMRLFFDENLSEPRNQSCASCHDPSAGFASPHLLVNLVGGPERGAVRQRFGNRKPPTASYTTFANNFRAGRGGPAGGLFMDGRATGEVIDESIFPSHWSAEFVEIMTEHANAAADQAMAPFLNAVEQNLPSAEVLCQRVEEGSYADLYAAAWGEPINCSEPVFVEQAHKRIAFAIAVFEASDKVNSFSSRRDLAIADEIATYGEATFPLDGLSDQENLGHDLFYLRPPINCAAFCHSSRFGADGTDLEEPYTSANAGYFNIGVPRNPTNPWYLMQFVRDNDGNIINPLGKDWVDLGLAFRDDNNDGLSDFPDRKGEFRTPTVRNTASKPFVFFVKAYMHNGYFKSLKQVVHFYNTRDMKPVCTNRRGEPQKFVTAFEAIRRGCWPLPEEFGRVDDNQDGVIDENDEPNIFGCDRISDCKVELAEGQTYETYCDDPEADLSIGNMCLTDEEEDALVAYMEALTDQEVMVSPAALDGEDN